MHVLLLSLLATVKNVKLKCKVLGNHTYRVVRNLLFFVFCFLFFVFLFFFTFSLLSMKSNRTASHAV